MSVPWIRQIIWVAAVTVVGCVSKPSDPRSDPRADPWAACATAGPTEYGEQPVACTSANCRQCASVLSQAWRDRQLPAWQGKFDARFLRSAAGARELVIQQAHPEGEFAFQHCTVGMASGARCAAYSDACATTLADAMLDTSDDTTHRDAARVAFRNACVPARDATLRALQRCEAFAPGPTCTDAACRDCTERQIRVIRTLVEVLPAEAITSAFDALSRHSLPATVNDVMNRFPPNEPPVGITQTTADQVVHSYCFQTREDVDAVSPRCFVIWGEVLTHPEHPEHTAAWAALAAAGPRARKNLLVTALVSHAPDGALAPFVREHLRTLPIAGTREAVVMVMGAVTIQTPQYDELRQILVDRGVTGTDLPPAVRTNQPAPAVRPVPPARR